MGYSKGGLMREEWRRVTAWIFVLAMLVSCLGSTTIIASADEPETLMIFATATDATINEIPTEEMVFGETIEYVQPGAIIVSPAMDIYEDISDPPNIAMAEHLTKSGGVFYGPSGKETWYNLDMSKCLGIMAGYGYNYNYNYWIRDDGVKMYGYYVMVAANTFVYPKGTILDTSMGKAIVVDHCVAGFIDICVTW